jgi:hypothetical protein
MSIELEISSQSDVNATGWCSYLATLANWVFWTAAAACEGGIIFKGYE